MIGNHARFRENDNLPVWQGPAAKKKPRKIMRSWDAQCNTGE